MLRWLKTVVVSDCGKGVQETLGGDQEDGAQSAGETPRIAVEVSLLD